MCKEQKASMTQDEVDWQDCCSLHGVRDVFWDLLQYTRTEKCNLFVLYNKNPNGLLKILPDVWDMEKDKNKSADVICHGFDVICI